MIRVTSTTTNVRLTTYPDGSPVRVTSWVAGYQGPAGPEGPAGPASTIPGPAGADGIGVPAGGTTGQALVKSSDADYATGWGTVSGGASLGTANPLINGTAAPGTATVGSRADHVHPTDTTRAADDAVVKLTGNQTIAGVKTFTGRTHFNDALHLYVNGSNPANPETGEIFYSDSAHSIKYYDGSSWDTVMDLEDAQTVTGTKDFGAGKLKINGSTVESLIAAISASAAPKTCLWLPGSNGNNITAPDAADLRVTGDIDLIARVALTDWTPAPSNCLMARFNAGTKMSYAFNVISDGKLQFYWAADGTTNVGKNSTVAPTVADGAALWLRCTMDVDNGAGGNTITFYTAPDSADVPTSWTQLGNQVTTAGTTSIFAGTANLEIGSWYAATAAPFAGKYYRAIVKNGIGGTTVADWRADFTHVRSRDAYGNLFTVNGTANAWMVA